MASVAQFRKLALAQPGAEEGSHQQHADFRAGGKIFAGLTPDGARATLKMTPETQAMVTSDDAFEPCAGAWGRAGWTFVDLARVKIGALEELVADAARLVAPKPKALAKTKAATKALAKPKPRATAASKRRSTSR